MLKLSDLIISSQETLRNAMQRMTQNYKGVLFVCDHSAHLIGVLSDGDVRRTLLDDTLLVAPVSKVMNVDPITAETTQEAINLLHRLAVVAVPVVDLDGQIKEVVIADKGGVKVLREVQRGEEPAISHVEKLGAVAIIPARGGSKRISRKNLAMVAGRPLVAWAILAAKAAKQVSHVIVSTDDLEIAEVVRSIGGNVPWLRPDELARDCTPTLDVILHALNWSVQTLRPTPEFGVLLEPTAPLRRPEHIDQAIGLLAATGADSVVSVCELPHVLNPEELLIINGGLLRPYLSSRMMDSRKLRGQQHPVYVQSGLVYAFRIQSVLKQRSLYGQKTLPLITSWEYFLDVDTLEDLQLADFKMRQLHAKDQIE
jgi:N-acylneuraminate cytidylyltransferase/CMP-N,N'-diacetyllegionaminic acid synthase